MIITGYRYTHFVLYNDIIKYTYLYGKNRKIYIVIVLLSLYYYFNTKIKWIKI